MRFLFLFLISSPYLPVIAQPITGRVAESVNGQLVPLTGANIYWKGTTTSTTTNATGRFSINPVPQTNRLIISYVGNQADTVLITNVTQPLAITLRAAQQLQEVVVSAGASTQLDRLNPIQTELITQRTLAKAACCNLSESFETNASVSVQYADAVTGAKQIQFLGLGGQYVQTNVENIPTIRGLATTFGLNYLPGTWITSIDVGKGAGSVVNGYESMTGQLNVELQKPDDKTKLFLNTYANSFGRLEGNVNYSQALSKKWSIGVLGHASTLHSRIDQNKDGFLDLPLYTQYNGGIRAKYSSERFMAQFGIRALTEDRTGGQAIQAGNTPFYQFTNNARRIEFFSKTAKLYPEKPYKGLGLILNGVRHEQTARFGYTPYTGQQQTLYANLIYQTIIGTTNHGIKTGLSYMVDDYQENYALHPLTRRESVPGAFLEYTYSYLDKLTLVAGSRIDRLSVLGQQALGSTLNPSEVVPNQWASWQFTPRLHLKYNLNTNLALRASAGRGFRMPNQLAENFGYLVSSRTIYLNYDVRPEVSWNYGLSLSNDFLLLGRKATFTADFYHTDFQNQLVVDLEHPRELYFYNLQGKSFANSFQAELTYIPAKRVEVKAAYRLYDVEQTMGGPFGENRLLPRMMVSRDRVLLNAGYALPYDRWKADITLQYNGPKRIPYLREGYVHTSYQNMPTDLSPGFFNLNAQVSHAFQNGLEVYLGGENLTGFRQLNPILAANDPFSINFDAGARVWGPITGQMVYAGARFKLTNP